MNRPAESDLTGAVENKPILFQCIINLILKFLGQVFQAGCEYRTICSYKSVISAYLI